MTPEQADQLISLLQSTNMLITVSIFLTIIFRFWRGGNG